MNSTILIGRLVRDPELTNLQTTSVARFTLAVDKQLSKEKKAEFEAKGQPTADFINIVVWGKMAESCATYLAKGRLVAVNGRIETGRYENKEGQTVYTTDVVANQVQFLEWGEPTGNQAPQQGQGQPQQPQQGYQAQQPQQPQQGYQAQQPQQGGQGGQQNNVVDYGSFFG